MVLPSGWKPHIYIIAFACFFLLIYLIYILEPPRAEWGDTVKIKYSIYRFDGSLFETSPSDGYEYVLLEDVCREPSALFESVYHQHIGDRYTIKVDSCPTYDCIDFGGYRDGGIAWQYQRYEIVILEIIKS